MWAAPLFLTHNILLLLRTGTLRENLDPVPPLDAGLGGADTGVSVAVVAAARDKVLVEILERVGILERFKMDLESAQKLQVERRKKKEDKAAV